jgi:hypothetical protein
MDLFVKGRKVSWTSLHEEDPKGRVQMGARLRAELYGKLAGEEKEHISRLEQEILRSRA